MLSGLASNDSEVTSDVITIVSKEDHIHIFNERNKLWNSLLSTRSLMSTLVKGLIELFINIYKSCQKGKDKYCRFQIDWHKQCSMLLTDRVNPVCEKELSLIHQRWLGFCEGSGDSKEVRDPVMIAIYSAVFEYLMQKVTDHRKKHQPEDDGATQALVLEEGVYYRFGGAALASMLKLRYSQLKSVNESRIDSLKLEITVLKAIQCSDKSQIPEYLKYRDMGHTYFPASRFIPFIKKVDQCVLEYPNCSSYKKHGSRLVEEATENLWQNKDLETQFVILLKECYEDYHRTEIVHTIFHELTRKLWNTRIQQFLDVFRQVAATKDGGASTLSGQNLRDKLLTYHENPK